MFTITFPPPSPKFHLCSLKPYDWFTAGNGDKWVHVVWLANLEQMDREIANIDQSKIALHKATRQILGSSFYSLSLQI